MTRFMLVFALLWPAGVASAQHSGSTTIGALMTAAVDTIELVHVAGGRAGSHSASLVLGRTESAFVGLLKYQSRRQSLLQPGRPPAREACDTTMVATMSLQDADRFLRELDTIRVDAGDPQERVRVITDFDDISLLRLRLPTGSLVIRDGRGVAYAGAVYHVPTSDVVPRKPGVFSLGPQDGPALRAAQDGLFVYLRLEEMNLWARRCFGEIR